MITNPDAFVNDDIFSGIAQLIKELQLIKNLAQANPNLFELKKEVPEYKIYGKEYIDKEAISFYKPQSLNDAVQKVGYFYTLR